MMELMKKHPRRQAKKGYFIGTQDREFNLGSMRKYLKRKPEMDKVLETMIAPYMKTGIEVLDACCGIGHLTHSLHKKFPRAHYLGIDETPYLIKEARKLSAPESTVEFEIDDLYSLRSKYKKAFDISICWKTLTWLHSYEDALRALVAVSRKHIFLSSLFYEGDIDYEIHVREYAKERGASGHATYHNIYSLPRFENFARSLDVKQIRVTDFKIGIDLPRGSVDHMGTYTLRLKRGTRMQMSGALPMPWKIIHIEL